MQEPSTLRTEGCAPGAVRRAVPGRWPRVAAALLAALFAGVLLWRVPERLSWTPGLGTVDPTIYWCAGAAAAAGADPYQGLDAHCSEPLSPRYPYVYPPMTAAFLAWLAPPYAADFRTWWHLAMGLALAGLLYGTRVVLLPEIPLAASAFALAFGGATALFHAVYGGNFALLVAGALFAALPALARGRAAPFLAIIGAAALVKFQFLAFLAVPFLAGVASLRRCALIGFAVGLCYLLDASIEPDLFREWLGNLGSRSQADFRDLGNGFPTVVEDLANAFGRTMLPTGLGQALMLAGWAALAAGLCGQALWWRIRLGRQPPRRAAIALGLAVATLCLPRLPAYEMVPLIPAYAALGLAVRPRRRPDLAALFAAAWMAPVILLDAPGTVVYVTTLGLAAWMWLVGRGRLQPGATG